MISKTNIKIVILGANPKIFSVDKLRWHNSKLFNITNVEMVHHLPDMDGESWGHSCETLSRIVVNGAGDDFTIGITGNVLEDNFYIKRLNNKACVMSFFGLQDVIRNDGNTIDNFIIRNIYELEVIHRQHNGSLNVGDRSFVHDDTRGCLFDMNGWKENIIYSMHRPILCEQCIARLRGKSLPHGYIEVILPEIKNIQKPFYNQASDWIKWNPWKAFLIGSSWAVVLNITASIFYEMIKK